MFGNMEHQIIYTRFSNALLAKLLLSFDAMETPCDKGLIKKRKRKRKRKHYTESFMASDLSHPTCAALFCRCFSLRFWNRRLHHPRPPPRPTHASRQLAQTPHDRRCEASALPAFAARSRDCRVWCLVHVRQNLPRLSPNHCDAKLSPDVHHLLGDRCRFGDAS